MNAVTEHGERGEAHGCFIENVTTRKPRGGWHPPQPFFILPTDLQNMSHTNNQNAALDL